jgi:predicted 3-demethylubiquinone-9 3-methyltransferase (glyoxalase superfamily)
MAGMNTSKITPCLWFDKNAEEAVRYYVSIFKNSKIIDLNPVLSTFELEGQRLMALNGGPYFKFDEAVSLFLSCKDQAEVDYYWQALTADGGKEVQCGWLKDKYGLSWQVVPEALGELMGGPDPVRSGRVRDAMLKMIKLDVAGLKKAYNG